MLLQFVMIKTITTINRSYVFQFITTGIVLICSFPVFLVCTYTISFNNLKPIHHTIVFFIRNEQVNNITNLHSLICLFPIGNS